MFVCGPGLQALSWTVLTLYALPDVTVRHALPPSMQQYCTLCLLKCPCFQLHGFSCLADAWLRYMPSRLRSSGSSKHRTGGAKTTLETIGHLGSTLYPIWLKRAHV